ncbi:MAG: hypothetical protein JSU65_04480, partial [Candidatus Zixiibacteriota bacterium]
MRAKVSIVSRQPGEARDVVQVGRTGGPSCLGSSQPSGLIHAAQQFPELFEHTRTRADRSGLGFSLVVFNVDGARPHHLLADELQQALSGRLSPTDNVGWLDDERIGILLLGASGKDAHRLAHDIRAA